MKNNTTIDASWTVNDVIEKFPDAITTLNALGLDTCCGGNLSLAESAAEAGIDADKIIAELISSVSETAQAS